jgi:hypothetical protein
MELVAHHLIHIMEETLEVLHQLLEFLLQEAEVAEQ